MTGVQAVTSWGEAPLTASDTLAVNVEVMSWMSSARGRTAPAPEESHWPVAVRMKPTIPNDSVSTAPPEVPRRRCSSRIASASSIAIRSAMPVAGSPAPVGEAGRPVHDEQVDVGIAIDEADVGVSEAAYEVGDLSALAQGLEPWPDLGEDVRGDLVGHREVQPVAVTEVAVENRLARARAQGDLVDGDRRTVRTDRTQGGVDERGAPLDAMLLPSGVASVSMLHAVESTPYFTYLLLSVSGFLVPPVQGDT